MPRWRPEDVNRGAECDGIAAARELGVPVEVHEPEICPSIPHSASVTAGNVPTAPSRLPRRCPCRTGAPASLVTLQANPRALRSYNRDIATLFGGTSASVEAP